jgi:predicted DNA-binding protein
MTKKSNQENLQNIVFRMTPTEIERLDRLASKIGLNRSQFLRNLVMEGVEETEVFEKVGLIRAAITVRDIYRWMAMKGAQGLSDEIDKDDK